MQSWSLEKFISEYGEAGAAQVWGRTQQAVNMAKSSERDIQIILIDGVYEVRESKLLNAINARNVFL
jgi:hypothetical protein